MNPSLLTIIIITIIVFHTAYLIGIIKKDFSVIDIFWGPSIAIPITVTYFLHFSQNTVELLLICLTIVWAMRLALYILIRSIGKGEDFRYKAWREEWGEKANMTAYLRVFWLQTVLALFLSIPLYFGLKSIVTISPIQITFGALLWLVGFLFETIADFQVYQFKKIRKPGEILTSGLFKYSRHPNYFGESLLWWGIGIMGASAETYFLSMIGPLFITAFIYNVSGIPLLEQKYADNINFQNWVKQTNAFIPWFPKKLKGE